MPYVLGERAAEAGRKAAAKRKRPPQYKGRKKFEITYDSEPKPCRCDPPLPGEDGCHKCGKPLP